ncbi:antibiotic biosynthesis monooxygenase [Actinomadura spongiicola]|uniref:Antibiotic biosynthesis monooxygenase n=1 Tax=Actinomadura spongiicola TaxID=2303421 RepID=A0A372GHZ5_9ACTN|nr:antibiotic biosynthesis monooxygenase [Actinomadura spongiicola]RFS84986.1 antibiotic biosynthesis monooxygenase [Actinomadura spongiicola]
MQDEDGETVTTVLTWDVKPGRERDFEEWAVGLHRAATSYPGHQGATWLRAEGSRHRYYTVVNFADRERLDAWLGSAERAAWIDRVRGIAREHHRDTTGLETWFSLPGESVPPPSDLKMIAVTFCAVYPLSLLLQAFVTPSTTSWPLPLKALVFPVIVIPLLTLLVMPALSRLFRRWLYPMKRTHRPAKPGR